MTTMRFAAGLLAAGAALSVGWAADTVPAQINYQGLLVNPDNTPLANGNYQIQFSIYDQPTGGSRIWGPQTLSATVYSGQFNVLLGPSDTGNHPLNGAFLDPNRYLEIQVGNNPAIAPRQQILSAPFALNAGRLNSKGWEAVFNNGDPDTGVIPGAKLSANSITGAQIAAGTIQQTNLGPNSVTSTQIVDGTIQQADLGPIYRLAASDGSPTNALEMDASGNATFIGNVTAGGNVVGDNLTARVLTLAGYTMIAGGGSYPTITLSTRSPLGSTNSVNLVGAGAALTLQCNTLGVTNLQSGTATPLYWSPSSKSILQGNSSRRYKDQIQPLQDDFSKILNLEPKQYIRKDQPETREVGYIAEDLDQAGLRDVTVYDAQGRPEAIDYARLIIYANEVLKEHQAKIRKQEAELQAVKAELEALRQLVRQPK